MAELEGPYRLPESWRWVRLGDVCEVIMGQSPPSRTYNTQGDGLPFFQGKADFGELYPTPRTWCSSPQKIAQPGDVLISVRAPVGPTNLADAVCCIGRGLAALRVSDVLEKLFLLQYLRSIEDELAGEGTGSTFTAITKKQLQQLSIPLPPLSEQRRIVARIEELMGRIREARRLREEAKKDADRLMQAALAEVFPRPGQDLPPGWRWVRLGEVCETLNGVWGPRGEHGDFVLRSTNFTDEGDLLFDDVARVLLTPKQREKALLRENDILLERSGGGPKKPVGRVCLFVGGPEDRVYYFGNFITVLRTRRADTYARFLFHYLRWFHISGQTERLQTQTTNIRNLRFREYLQILIPLPPLEEQRRIVAHLEEVRERVRALKEAQATTEAELQRLEQAILNKAFQGEL